MPTLLQIDSSGRGTTSVTRPLTSYCAAQWKANNYHAKVVYRDLLTSELPFVNEEIVGAYYTPQDQQTAHQKNVLVKSDQLIDELLAADCFVFGVPMYNFSVPAVFKAYIDLTVRAGKTFSFEGGMPKGLLIDKTAIFISSSGGDYSAGPMKAMDFVEPYVRAIFGFIGVKSIQFLTVPGRDPATLAAGSARAQEQMDKILQVAARV